MFTVEADWSDEEEAHSLSQLLTKDSQKTNSNSKTKQSKVVGRKSLMRTLQTLGSVPEWKSEDKHENSDSDSDAARSPCTKKRKKKRNRKRKPAVTPEEHQENGGADEPVEGRRAAPKKQKKDADLKCSKVKNTSSSAPMGKKIESAAQVEGTSPESTGLLSRQQWKTKMKNKRRCKNKYRPERPGEEVKGEKQEEKQAFKPDLNGSSDCGRTMKKKREKQQMEREGEVVKSADCKNHVTEQPKKQNIQLSREQSLKREKLRKLLQMPETEQHKVPTEQKDEPQDPQEEVEEKEEPTASDSFRSRMEQRLESAHFRYINEVLYTTTSGEAKRMFSQDPQAFWVYHKGYTAQVQRWPCNPVDAIISFIRHKPASLVIADFGCGDCKIARNVKNKVHSFDLVATCDLVTACDMAHVPLKDSSVDIAVFCLSLMGTNLAEFLAEANRVLRKGGVLKVAEVASRFEDVRNFITALSSLGFKLVSKDTNKSHFYSFEFVKTGNADKLKKVRLQLKPCVYKKR